MVFLLNHVDDMGNDYPCVFVVHMLSEMFLCDHVNIDKIRCGLSKWIELS